MVKTEDGSYTLFSEKFQEACHSTSGARSETLLHYFHGCEVPSKLEEGPIQILEVGFGLGIGFLATFDEIQKLGLRSKWSFLSVELDRDLLEWFRLQHANHHFLKNLEWREDALVCADENCELTILAGNARQTLPLYLKEHLSLFDVIYQDAFSPKKNPILWTKEWFELLRTHSRPGVIMSTYSASSSIRKSMIEAGWKLYEGDRFGPKRSSTRARLLGETSEVIMDRLNRSPASCLTDSTCSQNF